MRAGPPSSFLHRADVDPGAPHRAGEARRGATPWRGTGARRPAPASTAACGHRSGGCVRAMNPGIDLRVGVGTVGAMTASRLAPPVQDHRPGVQARHSRHRTLMQGPARQPCARSSGPFSASPVNIAHRLRDAKSLRIGVVLYVPFDARSDAACRSTRARRRSRWRTPRKASPRWAWSWTADAENGIKGRGRRRGPPLSGPRGLPDRGSASRGRGLAEAPRSPPSSHHGAWRASELAARAAQDWGRVKRSSGTLAGPRAIDAQRRAQWPGSES